MFAFQHTLFARNRVLAPCSRLGQDRGTFTTLFKASKCFFDIRKRPASVNKSTASLNENWNECIEFDRDCDYFAITSVTKKIEVVKYGTVIQDAVDIHCPINSKISCISWSSYHKNLLASSDYEGTVILWDGFTGQRSKVYQESNVLIAANSQGTIKILELV